MNFTPNKSSAGFGLVELMVALVIGMILMAGISSVFVSNKKTYTQNDSLARLQENGRVAMQLLSRDIRSSGYYGCNYDKDNITSLLTAATSFSWDVANRVEAIEFGGTVAGTAWSPSNTVVDTVQVPALPNTDAIAIRFVDISSAAPVTVVMKQDTEVISVDPTTTGIQKNDILLLADCSTSDIFQVTAYNEGATADTVEHDTTGGFNSTSALTKAYSTNAKLYKLQTIVYYIGTGTNGEPALFRGSQEIVEGIQNLQILYGKDEQKKTRVYEPKQADRYLNATLVNNGQTNFAGMVPEWEDVVSVRVAVLARSLANLQTSANKSGSGVLDTGTYDLDEDGTVDYDASADTLQNQMYQRRIFRTTLLMRNIINDVE